MENNKKFILIILITFLVCLVLFGLFYFVFKDSDKNLTVDLPENVLLEEDKNSEETIKNDTDLSIDNSEFSGLREYKNTEAGFSFKYPTEYGEITIKKVEGSYGGGDGYVFQGITETNKNKDSFYFGFSSKNHIGGSGDFSDEQIREYEANFCTKEPGVSCEEVVLKNGSKARLVTRLGVPQGYMLDNISYNNVFYKGLYFISSNRSILLDIASTIEIFPSSVKQEWTTLAENQTGFGEQLVYPSNWNVTYMKGGSYGTADSVVGVILKPSVNSPAEDSISIGGFQYNCSNVNVSGGSNPSTKAYCISGSWHNIWSGYYILSDNQRDLQQESYKTPMVTNSTNLKVLEMFDLIVKRNTY